MKKLISFIIVILLTFSLTGCKSKISKDQNITFGKEETVNAEILTIEDYFPFKENIIMEYKGIGNEYAEQITFFEFVEGKRAQMKIMNPGTVLVKVLEYGNGELVEVFSEGEFYHIENMLNTNSNSNNTILKEPIEIGNQWPNSDGYKMEITELNKEVDTPYGTYEALEVTTLYEEDRNLKEYYVKDVGLVAKVYSDGDFVVETLLENMEIEKQLLEIMSFYPRGDDIGTAYVMQEMEFGTNEDIEGILETIMKEAPKDNLIPAISENTKINSIYLNRDTWTLEVDFSKELFSEMNAGSTFEVEILKSIVNTLGKFYDVEKVYITLEDVPYESGHIGINPGEYFTVDTKDIEEFK